jgi:outer membrane protein OmpA-like peptidoglycan-associated protein
MAAGGAASAADAPINERIMHPDGLSLMVKSIERLPDSIVLSATITNRGDHSISLDRARSFVLEEGGHAVHYLNPPAGNPELLLPAHSDIEGRLVFIGPAAPATRQLTLSANEGIGTPDNPYDNQPVLRAALPIGAEDSTAAQATHPSGTTLRIERISANPGGCVLSVLATNGNDRAIRLNQASSLALIDPRGASAPVEPPRDNPDLVVPPGARLDAELAFPCGRLDASGGLTLSSNRGTGGTPDNPYETMPVFTLALHPETVGPGSPLPASHAAITPIARSVLAPARGIAVGAVESPAASAPRSPPEPPKHVPASPAETDISPPPPAGTGRTATHQPATPTSHPATASQLEKELRAARTDRGLRIVLPADELFGSSRDSLDPGADAVLTQLDELIAATHPREIDIAGHTDSEGDDEDNLKLSEERAHAVAVWLEQHSPRRHPRFVEKGYGRTRPVAPNHNPDGSDNPDGRARNRRIDILLRR